MILEDLEALLSSFNVGHPLPLSPKSSPSLTLLSFPKAEELPCLENDEVRSKLLSLKARTGVGTEKVTI